MATKIGAIQIAEGLGIIRIGIKETGRCTYLTNYQRREI